MLLCFASCLENLFAQLLTESVVLPCCKTMWHAGLMLRCISLEDIWLVDSDKSIIKVAGFGMSCQLDSKQGSASRNQTEAVAPEVLRNRCSVASDYWAVGNVLYHLVAGYPVFDGTHGMLLTLTKSLLSPCYYKCNIALCDSQQKHWALCKFHSRTLFSQLLVLYCSFSSRAQRY